MLSVLRKITTHLRRPLVLIPLTIFANVILVNLLTAWLYFQYRVISAELHRLERMICIHLDKNGMYLTYLPPQKGISGKDSINISELKLEHGKTGIERNLSAMPARLELPGIAFWRTSAPQDYDRSIVRIRFGFLLLVFVLFRIGLLRLKRLTEMEKHP